MRTHCSGDAALAQCWGKIVDRRREQVRGIQDGTALSACSAARAVPLCYLWETKEESRQLGSEEA